MPGVLPCAGDADQAVFKFVLNLETDEVEWLEEFSQEDQGELESEAARLIGEANAFYDREVSRYDA